MVPRHHGPGRNICTAWDRYLGTLKNIKALDVLPYHDMGKAKYSQMGIPYPLEDTAPLPPAKAAEARKIILRGMRDERAHCS